MATPTDPDGFRIWIPLPVAALGVLLSAAAGLLVLGPSLAGSALALAFFVLLPGLAVVRLLGLHDTPLEVVLGIALSFAIAGLVSVIQAYFGGWSPTFTLGALAAITVAAAIGPLVATLVRGRQPRSSVVVAPVAGSSVAWPSPTARSVESPASVGPRSVGTEPWAAPTPLAVTRGTFPPFGALPGPIPPGVPASVAPPPTVTPAAPAPAASDLPPPPPVAIIRKRPKPAPGSPTAGNLGSRPNRATRSAINQIVDDLADDRDAQS